VRQDAGRAELDEVFDLGEPVGRSLATTVVPTRVDPVIETA
jgi:hypothetical protein